MFALVLIVVVTVVSLVVALVTILVLAFTRMSRKEPYYEVFDEEMAMDSDQVKTQFTPAISFYQRVADVGIDGQAIQPCPWGTLRILQRFTGWSFHTYRCELKSVLFTVIYGNDDPELVWDRIHDPFSCGGGHHPIVNMFQVYREVSRLEIAPIAFYLSDPGEISQDRFLIVEAVSDRFMDRYAYPTIQSKEKLTAFLLDLIRIVVLIEGLHGEGYYTNNMHIGSFVYRARDGMVVLWDLSCAKKGTMDEHGFQFNNDLCAVIDLLAHGLRTGDVYRNTRIVSEDLKRTVSEIYNLVMIAEGIPAYAKVKDLLRRHI